MLIRYCTFLKCPTSQPLRLQQDELHEQDPPSLPLFPLGQEHPGAQQFVPATQHHPHQGAGLEGRPICQLPTMERNSSEGRYKHVLYNKGRVCIISTVLHMYPCVYVRMCEYVCMYVCAVNQEIFVVKKIFVIAWNHKNTYLNMKMN